MTSAPETIPLRPEKSDGANTSGEVEKPFVFTGEDRIPGTVPLGHLATGSSIADRYPKKWPHKNWDPSRGQIIYPYK